MNNWPVAYWSLPEEEILQKLSSSSVGLTEAEASDRHKKLETDSIGGRNRSTWSILAAQFNNPIVILLFASAILSYFLDDKTNAFIILVILALSGLLSFWQERSAADAVAKLLNIIKTTTTVIRGGSDVTISIDMVVPGDIVLLRSGSLCPGDCRILESNQLCIDESALTGESFPVEKTVGQLPADTVVSKRTNCLFLGTHVVSGTGKALVVQVSGQTEFGRISKQLEKCLPTTGFERGLRNFGKMLLAITGVLVVIVFLASIYFHRPVVESALFALALAVGMTPQLLPAITSVVLATGALSMARVDVIVKRLLAIENFGGMDILCLDKTGTLTEGSIELVAAADIHGNASESVLRVAALNAHLQLGFQNSIDAAIVRKLPDRPSDVARLDECPYDFKRRRLSVLVEESGLRLLISKGAFEKVLEVCESVALPTGEVETIDRVRDAIYQRFVDWSNEGYRVLAIATRRMDKVTVANDDEAEMTFLGFLIFTDPPKPGLVETLLRLEQLGIRLKLITGDNRLVASAIARKVGFKNTRVISGSDIDKLSKEQLCEQAANIDIFAEIEPAQKERIVLSLKSSKHVVGFLGDGINDAPAMHVADIGISVSSAVDVAKEAAQVVMLKSDLNVLARGVLEGRRTLANTLKYVFVSISANFGYMLSMAIASLFLPFLPLLPSQILLINLLADFPAMALATDSVDPEIIDRPRQWDVRSILRFMLMFGLTGTCFDLLTFAVLLHLFQATHEEFRTGWFMVSIFTGLLIMLAVRTRRPFFRSQPGIWLIVAALGVATVTICLPFMELGKVFELVRPTPSMLAMVTTISLFYAVAMELGKRIFYRRPPNVG